MSFLVTIQGPDVGRKFPLGDRVVLGRQFDSNVVLNGKSISRQHAQVLRRADGYFLEDLGSSNGTFLNSHKIAAHQPVSLAPGDTVQIGDYLFSIRVDNGLSTTEPKMVVRESISARSVSVSTGGTDASVKLQVVLEISRHLARTLDVDPLLEKLLEQLLILFPQVDRALAILCEENDLAIRAQRSRRGKSFDSIPFSRTIVRRALEEGVGLLSEDVKADERFNGSATLTSLDLHSVLCVPLIGQEGKRLGVLQLDRFSKGSGLRLDDLHMLTTIGLQVAVAMENAELHAQRLAEQRLHHELDMARDIQQGFLPGKIAGLPDKRFEILGRVYPARQVAGDFYDYLFLPDGRIAFFVGDVSGKGVPAALFMVAVRSLCRHMAREASSPGALLAKLNDALADDNPAGMFVTLVHGWYDPANGKVILASGGHPHPLLRSADGAVAQVTIASGRLLGFEDADLSWKDQELTLAPGDALIIYTDGLSEARPVGKKELLGSQRLAEVFERCTWNGKLEIVAEQARTAVEQYTGGDIQDDATILMLRRKLKADS